MPYFGRIFHKEILEGLLTFKNKAEFAKYLKENPDPLGVQKSGGFKEYTWEEIAQHNAPPSVWSVYKGDVYDITMFINVLLIFSLSSN